jgi:hypothetical protein
MSPSLLGFVRGLGFTVLLVVLNYLGDAAHLSGLVSVSTAALVSSLALALEHAIENKTGNALFGAVAVGKK